MDSSLKHPVRAKPDSQLTKIVDYAIGYRPSEKARAAATLCLKDALACAMQALEFPDCTKILGPVVPGAELERGARVPGTRYQLDPVQATFNLGAMIRWLDFNDTWLAAEWGHPSDNIAAILSCADYRARNGSPLAMREVLDAIVKAYEVQGILALENSFNAQGLDHVLLVRVASCALAAQLMGGTRDQILSAVSNAVVDGGVLRAYRHAPNTGSRKSWAAGDAAARGVFLALLALRGEMGYLQALSVKTWGFNDVILKGKALSIPRELGSYVAENILFKVSFPAEFHAQTAAEAAIKLHPEIIGRIEEIEHIEIQTTASGQRIIDKTGPLNNPADRDHCLQYVTAVALMKGAVTSEDYEDNIAADPRIDLLRAKMRVAENPEFTRDYYDLNKRAIANSVRVFFSDGSRTEKVTVAYPLGHTRRRAEAMPLLEEKFISSLEPRFTQQRRASMLSMFEDQDALECMPVHEFVNTWVVD